MSKTSYPTNTNVVDLLARAGFTVASGEAGDAAAAAIDEFERRTGRKMLAEGSDRARRYDPPLCGWLDLRHDLASLTSVVYTPEGGGSETLTANVDYWTEPYVTADAEPLTAPIEALRFKRRWYFPLAGGDLRSVVVTGKWGFVAAGTGFPEDAWQAVLHRAGALLVPEVGQKIAVARTQRSESGVQTSWGGDPAGTLADRWNGEFEGAVRRYRRGVM
jgi:hypothetical protein